MHFEINVAKNGRHYFATAERSITDTATCQDVYGDLYRAFPEGQGFRVSVTRWETTGQTLTFAIPAPKVVL